MNDSYSDGDLAAQLQQDLAGGESWHVEFKAYDYRELDTIDGRVEIFDEQNTLVGPLAVQVKTLPTDHKLKLSCPLFPLLLRDRTLFAIRRG